MVYIFYCTYVYFVIFVKVVVCLSACNSVLVCRQLSTGPPDSTFLFTSQERISCISIYVSQLCHFYFHFFSDWQEFSWKQDEEFIRSSDCLHTSNQPSDDADFGLELYGPNSRCFDQLYPFELSRCGTKFVSNHFGSGCYKVCGMEFIVQWQKKLTNI